MNTEGFRRILFGDKEPDMSDPKVRARYERNVEAGRRFAVFARLDKLAARVQQYAIEHTRTFLAIVFGFLFISFAMNVGRMAIVFTNQKEYKSALSRQDSVLHQKGITTHSVKNKSK